jgi:hypothetical protein
MKSEIKIFFTLATMLLSTFSSAEAWFWSSSNPEKVSVNVYFYYESDQEVFLGERVGVSACQSTAQNFAYSKKIQNTNWDYICCTIEKGSDCHRKIR